MRTINGKSVLTTGQVAQICHVAPRTVSKWFDTGKLRGFRIPGSRDRRIPVDQLQAFMRAHGIPLDALDGGVCRILVLSGMPERIGELAEGIDQSDRWDIRVAENEFEAGVLAQQFGPHVIVLDVAEDPTEASETCRRIRATPGLQSAKILAATAGLTRHLRQELIERGFDGCLARPYSPRQLIEAVEAVMDVST